MPDTASSASAAPLPSGNRPAWVHHARSGPAFWLPALGVLGMMVVLVLLWPRNHRHRAAQPHSIPEATASYVLLEGSYLLPAGGPWWPGSGGPALPPERDDTPARRLPLPEYTGLGVMSPWTPAQLGMPSNFVPNLAARPVAAVLTGLSPTANGLTLSLSAGLQRSGFHFDVPPGVVTSMTAVARFHVELDDKGEVIHLLAEPCDNPASLRLLETALGRGHGMRAGRGEVQVAWGR